MAGGFNVTNRLFLLAAGYRKPESDAEIDLKRQLAVNWIIGSRLVTIYNMTSRTWTAGPPLPVDANHNALVITPNGTLFSLAASPFLQGYIPRDPTFLPYFHSLDFAALLRGENVTWQARKRGHAAGTTGGFGCAWFRERVYCVGGASSATHVDGGYSAALTSYDPGTDTWQTHAPCPEAHHHAEAFVYGGRLWVVGGMSLMHDMPPPAKRPWVWPHYLRLTNIFASYDADTDTWSRGYRQLPVAMKQVQAQLVQRPTVQGGRRTTLLVVGGEHAVGEDGIGSLDVLEYDFVTDVWYCHPQLPRASFGGGHSYIPDRQQVVIVGGGDSYRVAATDDVLIVRLDQLTRFEACMYAEHSQGWYLTHPGHSMARHHPYKGQDDPMGRPLSRRRQQTRRLLRQLEESDL